MPYVKLTDAEIEDLNPFEPPPVLLCPQCDGRLEASTNKLHTLVFLECYGQCRLCWVVPIHVPPVVGQLNKKEE